MRPSAGAGLPGSIVAVFNALIQNSRFEPEDLALAADPEIGSLFLVAPSRGKSWPADRGHIAVGQLGSCLGFFSQAYREHDYFLGRRNAPRFLRWVFVLPRSNHAVFGTGDRFRGDSERARWGVQGDGGPASRMPIIPLCGDLLERTGAEDGTRGEPLPAQPARTLDLEEIKLLLEQRVGIVLPLPRDMPLTPLGPKDFKGTLMRQILKLITPDVSSRIAEFAMTKMRAGVRTVDAGAT